MDRRRKADDGGERFEAGKTPQWWRASMAKIRITYSMGEALSGQRALTSERQGQLAPASGLGEVLKHERELQWLLGKEDDGGRHPA
ncbi:hypothetical protein AA309_12395 [Microvirga vignae]|uniref:Uncharacterized protein n=1 Tax=Microvirga vignae TaxID=1225564 RepID=A0A0H1RCB7_9HYPH|nr:hypothetical protein AA309_12395 [Microvirga vignae]